MVAHHRCRDCEMESGRASVLERLRVQLALDGRGVIDNAQSSTPGEQAKVPRFLRRRRSMDEIDRISFHHLIGVADAELVLVDQQSVGWRLAFENGESAFNSPDPSDKGTGE